MTGGSRSLWQAAARYGTVRTENICISCLRQRSIRGYASEAVAPTESPLQPPPLVRRKAPRKTAETSSPQPAAKETSTPLPTRKRSTSPVGRKTSAPLVAQKEIIQQTVQHQKYNVQAGVVLSRPPQITRDLTPFEKAFFLYQRRLNERLAIPFSRYHYFTRGTPQFKEWQRKMKLRQTPAHEIGVYNAYGKEGWNDEVLVGAPEAETQHQVDALIIEASTTVPPKYGDVPRLEDVLRPSPRVTEADRTGDTKSLDRLLQRTLYLLVQTKEGRWTFPADVVTGREGLSEAAERVLEQGAGPNMNTWVVGNAPIGLHQYKYQNVVLTDESKTQVLGEKVFFLKARIAAGQVDLAYGQFGWKDYKWLSKEEIKGLVTPRYWTDIWKMLPQR